MPQHQSADTSLRCFEVNVVDLCPSGSKPAAAHLGRVPYTPDPKAEYRMSKGPVIFCLQPEPSMGTFQGSLAHIASGIELLC